MTEICGHRPFGATERDRLRGVQRRRRLVGPSAPVRPVRPHRVLRQLSFAPRVRAREDGGPPIIRSFEPGEDWFWNYETEDSFDGPGLVPPEHHPLDQGVPGPKERVPRDWRFHVH